jgi:virulence-associated protein VapD
MITIQQLDEYGTPYAVDTFLTIEDAKQTLNQLESSLEDCVTSVRAYRLMDAIDQLRQAIADHEDGDD